MFGEYLIKMTKLTNIIIDWSSKNLVFEDVATIVKLIDYFDELNKVELSLKNNLFENVVFEELLNESNNIYGNCSVVLNIKENNIYKVN